MLFMPLSFQDKINIGDIVFLGVIDFGSLKILPAIAFFNFTSDLMEILEICEVF